MKFSFVTTMSSLAGLLAVVQGIMAEVLGCKSGAVDLSAVCSASWLPSNIAAYAAIVFGGLALLGKMLAPGGALANLFGLKAVVLDEDNLKSGVGTVTPEQVAQP